VGRRVAAAACCCAVLAAARVTAQEREVEGRRVRCEGQRISDVQVRSRPPFGDEKTRWWELPLRWINSAHATTDPDVVLRYLLLGPGDVCVEARRADSERILRQMPFLASADIAVVDDEMGGVRLLVDTRDELSTVVSVSARGPQLTGFTFGNRNLGGKAIYGAVEWHAGDFRDSYRARVADYQFLGRRLFLDAEGRRTELGDFDGSFRLTRPYLTDAQRVAWRVSASSAAELFPFYRGAGADPVDVGLERTFLDVGGLVRIGQPGRLSLFGVSFSRETDAAGMPPRPDSTVSYPELLAPFEERSNARINALWALRNITFRRLERLDFLTAAQDEALGFQIGTLFGRSLSVLGTSDDDIFVVGDLKAGMGGGGTFVRVNVRGEGRQNFDTNKWDGIIGSGSATYYQRIGDRQTATATVEFGAGWNHRVPFQLSLGDRWGGVRGYKGSREAGSQRAVVRLEDRVYLRGFRSQADLGVAVFADAGRLWAGDAAYGVDTPVRTGVGVGLLAAIPRGARRNYRLDLAYALNDDGRGKRWEVRFSMLSPTRLDWREPRDLRRSRERATPDDMFP
jgi:hypothetical protein